MLMNCILWAFLNASIIFTLWKSGWFDWYENHKPKAFLWVPRCDFCFGLRLSLIQACGLYAFTDSSFCVFPAAIAVGAITFIIYKKMHA